MNWARCLVYNLFSVSLCPVLVDSRQTELPAYAWIIVIKRRLSCPVSRLIAQYAQLSVSADVPIPQSPLFLSVFSKAHGGEAFSSHSFGMQHEFPFFRSIYRLQSITDLVKRQRGLELRASRTGKFNESIFCSFDGYIIVEFLSGDSYLFSYCASGISYYIYIYIYMYIYTRWFNYDRDWIVCK